MTQYHQIQSHTISAYSAHKFHVNSASCTFDNIGYTADYPSGNVIAVYPGVYNCSGTYILDYVLWYFDYGNGTKLTNYWIYHTCGDWFSEAGGSPNVYLDYNNNQYTTNPGVQINPNGFAIDSYYNPGGQSSNCV